QRDIDTGVPYMVHDFAVTERRVVFVLVPVVFDLAGAREGKPLLSWQPERGTRIAILDRKDMAAPISWRETDPFFMFHILNAYDDRDAIFIDYVRFPKFAAFESSNTPVMARMILSGGAVQHSAEASPTIEFPRVDDRRRGLPHRWGYAASMSQDSRGVIVRF